MESLRCAARPWLSLFLCVVTSSTGAPARETPLPSTSSETLDSAGLNIELRRFQLENLSAVLFIVRASDPGLPWILDKVEILTQGQQGAHPRPPLREAWGTAVLVHQPEVLLSPRKGTTHPCCSRNRVCSG